MEQTEKKKNSRKKVFIIIAIVLVICVIFACAMFTIFNGGRSRLQSNSRNTNRKQVVNEIELAISKYEVEYGKSPERIMTGGNKFRLEPDPEEKSPDVEAYGFRRAFVYQDCNLVITEEEFSDEISICVDYEKKMIGVKLENSDEGYFKNFSPLSENKSETPIESPTLTPPVIVEPVVNIKGKYKDYEFYLKEDQDKSKVYAKNKSGEEIILNENNLSTSRELDLAVIGNYLYFSTPAYMSPQPLYRVEFPLETNKVEIVHKDEVNSSELVKFEDRYWILVDFGDDCDYIAEYISYDPVTNKKGSTTRIEDHCGNGENIIGFYDDNFLISKRLKGDEIIGYGPRSYSVDLFSINSINAQRKELISSASMPEKVLDFSLHKESGDLYILNLNSIYKFSMVNQGGVSKIADINENHTYNDAHIGINIANDICIQLREYSDTTNPVWTQNLVLKNTGDIFILENSDFHDECNSSSDLRFQEVTDFHV